MKLSGRKAQSVLAKPPQSSPAILLYGEDASRIASQAARCLEAHLGPNAAQEMRLDYIEPAKLRSDKAILADMVGATGFFPGPRAVRVDGAGDGVMPAVQNALEQWREGDALILLTAGILPTRSKLRKLFEAHDQAAAIAIYADPPNAAEVQEALQRAGLTGPPDRAALDALVSVAATMPALVFERFVDTLVLYHGDDKAPLSVDTVDALAPVAHDTALDTLVELTADGARDAAAFEAARVLAQGIAPTGVLIALTMRFRTMVLAKNSPDGPGSALARARPPFFGPRRDRVMRQLQGWREERLTAALHELLNADRTLREPGMALPAAALVSRTVIRVASLKR